MISQTGKRRADSKGFTLIELILVMALLVGLIALAAPRLKLFLKQRHLEAEAERFVAAIEFARAQAVNTGIPMQVTIDPEREEFSIMPIIGFYTIDQIYTYKLASGVHFIKELLKAQGVISRLRNSSGAYSIVFHPDGSLDPESLYTVGFEDDGGRRLFVVSSVWGGMFRVVNEQEYGQELSQLGINQHKR